VGSTADIAAIVRRHGIAMAGEIEVNDPVSISASLS